jgi:hypothetical protein
VDILKISTRVLGEPGGVRGPFQIRKPTHGELDFQPTSHRRLLVPRRPRHRVQCKVFEHRQHPVRWWPAGAKPPSFYPHPPSHSPRTWPAGAAPPKTNTLPIIASTANDHLVMFLDFAHNVPTITANVFTQTVASHDETFTQTEEQQHNDISTQTTTFAADATTQTVESEAIRPSTNDTKTHAATLASSTLSPTPLKPAPSSIAAAFQPSMPPTTASSSHNISGMIRGQGTSEQRISEERYGQPASSRVDTDRAPYGDLDPPKNIRVRHPRTGILGTVIQKLYDLDAKEEFFYVEFDDGAEWSLSLVEVLESIAPSYSGNSNGKGKQKDRGGRNKRR